MIIRIVVSLFSRRLSRLSCGCRGSMPSPVRLISAWILPVAEPLPAGAQQKLLTTAVCPTNDAIVGGNETISRPCNVGSRSRRQLGATGNCSRRDAARRKTTSHNPTGCATKRRLGAVSAQMVGQSSICAQERSNLLGSFSSLFRLPGPEYSSFHGPVKGRSVRSTNSRSSGFPATQRQDNANGRCAIRS